MTLPRLPRWIGGIGRRRAAAVAAVVLLAVTSVCRPSLADDVDPFSAEVAVDATADTPGKAREMARLEGQRRALAVVVGQLAGDAAASGKLPRLGDDAITNLVASFEVANERMSAVRYLGEVTFHFRPEETRRLLRGAGVALAGETGRPAAEAGKPAPEAGKPAAEPGKAAVVLPVLQVEPQARLWDDPNPWREAWDQQPVATGPVPLVVPLGDAGDIAAIDADKARAGNPEALAAVARHNGGEDAVVAVAALRGSLEHPAGLDLGVKLYRAGKLADSHAEAVEANPGEAAPDLLRRAAAASIAGIEGGWKKPAVAGYDQQGTLTAVLPISSLDDWLQARGRIAAVPTVRKLSVLALSRQEATIEIGYVGSVDRLKADLAGINLDLVQGTPTWRLARSAPPRAQ